MKQHLNQDEMLQRLYGLGEDKHLVDAHLDDCPECSGRLRAMELQRADSASEASGAASRITNDFLAVQRRAIYARIEKPAPLRVRWAPALAAGTLLAVGVLMYHPARPAQHRAPAPASRPELSEEQLFSDIFSMEQAAEPRAAAPIRALFEDQAPAEEQ